LFFISVFFRDGEILSPKELRNNLAGRSLYNSRRNTIYQQEFSAYAKNNFPEYEKIDRVSPFKSRGIEQNCRFFEEIPAGGVDSRLMIVEFPPRSSRTIVYRPTMENFFVHGSGQFVHGFSTSSVAENVEIQISTRLYIWASQNEASHTKLYLEARPISGQIEAGAGNSIGWKWWKIANGYEEQNIVRSYVLLLEDFDRQHVEE
jgi:hypothetical protein